MRAVWPQAQISASAAPWLPGLRVEVVPQIDSTNSELMRRARAGCREPLLLVAEHQTAGRGRLGRVWRSDDEGGDCLPDATGSAGRGPGALTFSLSLPLTPPAWSGLSLALGTSVAGALHERLRLKWPNDIWLDGRKLAGILVETASLGGARIAVIGIGINIRPRSGAGLSTPPAWMQELLPEIDASSLLQRIVPGLARSLREFESLGFDAFAPAFRARDALHGRAIVLSEGTQGIARGVDQSGALLVHTAAGLKTFVSAEVSVRPVVDGGA